MPITSDLANRLPAGALLTDAARMEKYRRDTTNSPSAGRPLAVARPSTPAQVQLIVEWCHTNHVPIVPRGAGSGLAGGATAVDGGVVLSLEQLTGLEVDPATRTVRAEAGVINAAVKEAASAHGLWYPPDPASFRMSTIGGNIATNAGGLCCVRYGVTRDYVVGLEVVWADGQSSRLGGPLRKDVAGLSLLHLLIGSEGTLGVVTAATLRLVPAPKAQTTLVALFPSTDAAVRAVLAIDRHYAPSMLEMMDQAAINAVEDFRPSGLDRTAGALLLVQVDTSSDDPAVLETLRSNDCREVFATTNPHEAEQFIESRRLVHAAAEARGRLLLEDVAVPVPLLPRMAAAVEGVSRDRGVEILVAAHAGDGNLHPVIVSSREDVDSDARAQRAFDDVMSAAIALGGSITGEHGVGRTKRHALGDQLGQAALSANRAVKAALDPKGILNPGAMWPDQGA